MFSMKRECLQDNNQLEPRINYLTHCTEYSTKKNNKTDITSGSRQLLYDVIHLLEALRTTSAKFGPSNKCVTINNPAFFVNVQSLCISLNRKDNPTNASLLTFQGEMACPQLNSWRPGGEQDTEARSLASHRKGDRDEGQTDRERRRRRRRRKGRRSGPESGVW